MASSEIDGFSISHRPHVIGQNTVVYYAQLAASPSQRAVWESAIHYPSELMAEEAAAAQLTEWVLDGAAALSRFRMKANPRVPQGGGYGG
jgi:hypothetical protein